MLTFKKLILILTVIIGISLAVAATSQVQTQKTPPQTSPRRFDKAEKAEFESQFPIANYESAESEDLDKRQKRRARNRRHNGQGVVATPENSREDRETALTNDWEVGLPALPVAQSDLVVMGEVTDAKAYLSDDKQGVYSEFSVLADEVLMQSGEAKITPGSVIATERPGGRVKFPSGITELHQVTGQGMPRPGHHYILFLKSTGEEHSYSIITGYEVRENRILPLDKRGVAKSKFDIYKGVSLDDFSQTVRNAVSQFRRTQKGGN